MIEPGDTREFSFTQGQDGTFPFELLNVGNLPLEFGSPAITIVDDCSGDFSVVTQPPSTLQPSEQATGIVAVNAERPGTFVATVAIHSNDPHHDPYLFTLIAHVEATVKAPSGKDAAKGSGGGCGIVGNGQGLGLALLLTLLLLLTGSVRRRLNMMM